MPFPPLDPPSESPGAATPVAPLPEAPALGNDGAWVDAVTVTNRRRGGWWRHLLRLAVAGIGAGATALVMAAGLLYTALAHDLPRLDAFDRLVGKGVTRFEAADGSLVGEQYSERRLAVAWSDLPRPLILAFLAAEDARFFEHSGIDFRGILRAMVTNLFSGGVKEGASTITQQLVKTLVGSDRNYVRKVKEAILARRLEDLYSKEQILTWYLNVIYLGHNSYGVQAAAQSYFRKNVWELSLAECAILAGVPQSPSRRNPFVDFTGAKKRMNHVLDNLVELGWTTAAEADAARSEVIKVWPLRDVWGDGVPEYAEAVRQELASASAATNEGAGFLDRGLSIQMAVEPGSQRAAAAALQAGLEALQKKQGFPGPLANIPEEKKEAFFAKNARWVPSDAKAVAVGQRLLARVAVIDKELAVLDASATMRGTLSLADAKWAGPYSVQPLKADGKRDTTARVSFGGTIDDLRQALAVGDVVLVEVMPPPKPATKPAKPAKPPKPPKPPKPAKNDKKKTRGPDDTGGEKALATAPQADPGLVFGLVPVPLVEGAVVATSLWTGGMDAMVGGWDHDRSQVNRAFADRPTGSSIKPLVYGLAYDRGFAPSTPVMATRYRDPATGWEVGGSSKVERMTAWDGLVNSENSVTVRVFEQVLAGSDDADIAAWRAWGAALGLDVPLEGNLSECLGSDQTPRGMLTAFTTFARDGRQARSGLVKKIVDKEGRILERHFAPLDPHAGIGDALDALWRAAVAPEVPAISPTTAYLVAKNLEAAVASGTGFEAKKVGRAAAGKTGTLDYDVWFAGFTGERAAVVWLGEDRNERPLGRSEGASQVYGSNTAAPIWASYMKVVDPVPKGAKRAGIGADVPPDVVTVAVDPASGLLARDGGTPIPHRRGTEPTELVPEILDPEF